MNIIICSFDYGGSSSGICTKRITEGLASIGHRIVVVTAICHQDNHHENIHVVRCSARPLSPARLYILIGNILGRDISHLPWELRAGKVCDNLCRNWNPNVVYGRGSPISGMKLAVSVSIRHRLPVVLHFADPIPATEDWLPSRLSRRRMIRTISPLLRHASRVSFVNSEAMNYQQKSIASVPFSDKCYISPNCSPPFLDYGPPCVKNVLMFVGSFLGSRKPDSLFAGLEIALKTIPDIELHLLGASQENVLPYISSAALKRSVRFLPRTTDVFKKMSQATLLVDVDADFHEPIFISNKLMEYLSVDRLILCITPSGSPAEKMVSCMSDSVVTVRHEPKSIAKAIVELLSLRWEARLFDTRRKKNLHYDLSRVVSTIEMELLSVCQNSIKS